MSIKIWMIINTLHLLLYVMRWIGFTGWICDEREGRSEAMAEVIKMVPDDKIMIETDAPYLVSVYGRMHSFHT